MAIIIQTLVSLVSLERCLPLGPLPGPTFVLHDVFLSSPLHYSSSHLLPSLLWEMPCFNFLLRCVLRNTAALYQVRHAG